MRKNSILTKSISHHVPEIQVFRFLKHADEMPYDVIYSNKLPQMRNISSNNCAQWNVPFVLA